MLDEAIAAAERRNGTDGVAVLDAGCGRASLLRPFRPRIMRLVGADIHPPSAGTLPYLDEFAAADLCADTAAFPAGSFDVILSNFTVEHFTDPAAAFRNMRTWLRPGGRLVITTVNRRHPFVAAYLTVPASVRARLQRLVKASAADAHPLVGACNDVAAVRGALTSAGFEDIHVQTVGHLTGAWGRARPTRIIGRLGDALARPFASRRSTIVASATA
ncbi:MAG TPA: methyltransferase domain-containing protein [Candidatus Limnocylindrales bacterium]